MAAFIERGDYLASQLADLPPINVKLDFDAATIDAMIERLAILRGQMLPPRKRQQGRAASPTGAMNGDDPPKRLRRAACDAGRGRFRPSVALARVLSAGQ
jgi:hypothetical protein